MRVWPGDPHPLGATWTGWGVNVAVVSEHATQVEVLVFERPLDATPKARLRLPERTGAVWHGFFPDLRPGALYGLSVDGPFDPAAGHRFNPAKLLFDPYARAFSGIVGYDERMLGYPAQEKADVARDLRPDAGTKPKCVVTDPTFDWKGDRPPRTPWHRTVIYECHVRGMTRLHEAVPPALRGTYLGLAAEPVVRHLQSLGVTALELMPVHAFTTEPHLLARGKTNYWGYNSIGYFAPDARFATAPGEATVAEFKSMVRALHAAGIEVILDVVYNHTGEGSQLGPTLSFRGLDNASYYLLDPGDRRRHVDYTGCGNTLNAGHPRVLQLLMDSLRYWVQEMHVDGFRFDLAPALVRGLLDMNRLDWFFALIQQDPVLCGVKLIAEPWDVGQGGYQVGNFPAGWAEWNGRYRDAVRRFWRGDAGLVPELASRLSGSQDLYGRGNKAPQSSVNFVTCHDGFTLADLVSYDRKHNLANGEEGRDGTDSNWSRNFGVEGPTQDPTILQVRRRVQRALLTTLAFSQGVPMLSMGDELGRTQRGNNNAYCQDDETSWVDWALCEQREELRRFTRRLLALRREHPVLRRRAHFSGRPTSDGLKDVTWIRQDGLEMTTDDWHDGERTFLGQLMDGQATDELDERGQRLAGETLLVLFNAGCPDLDVTLPAVPRKGKWRELLCSARVVPSEPREVRGTVRSPGQSVTLLIHDELSGQTSRFLMPDLS
jgi:isoamylase